MNKSRPVYAPFQLDPSGANHLVVTNLSAPPDGLDICLNEIELWVVHHISPGVLAPANGQIRFFRSVTELLAQLAHRLAHEKIGLRLYAIGAEAFIWDARNIASKAGLGQTEIFVHQSGPKQRRVYCTHCRTLIEDVAVTIVDCPVCESTLFVRDHFSRRLAAFMGVKVDAEVPGEIPPAEIFST